VVKLGFIREGYTEKNILESTAFRQFLDSLGLDYIENVINAKGGGNLIPDKLMPLVQVLENQGATQIIILTDLEDLSSIRAAKERVQASETHIIIIAVKMIEAWFLADTDAISTCLKQKYSCEFPEEIERPFDFIKQEAIKLTGRGFSKIMLCRRMLQSGFSVQNAAKHSNCPSAAYFIRKLNELT